MQTQTGTIQTLTYQYLKFQAGKEGMKRERVVNKFMVNFGNKVCTKTTSQLCFKL